MGKICPLKTCAYLFPFFRSFAPHLSDPKSNFKKNLESWFTTRPCHLNQVPQWSETKVQHRSEPRERAEPSGAWQLSFSGCDLGGGQLHCSPASSVLLSQRPVRGVTPCIKLPTARILAGTFEAVRGALLDLERPTSVAPINLKTNSALYGTFCFCSRPSAPYRYWQFYEVLLMSVRLKVAPEKSGKRNQSGLVRLPVPMGDGGYTGAGDALLRGGTRKY